MSKPPAFQFYADDFLAGTFSMTNEERGLYITLLCRQWTQGHVTRDEVSRLGSTVVQPSINHVLTKFQPDEDGNLRNARLEVERGKQNAFRAMQSAKGKASAEARFNRGSTVVQPSGAPKGNSPSPSPSPSSFNTPPLPPKGEELILCQAAGQAPPEKPPLLRRVENLFGRTERRKLSASEVKAWRIGQAVAAETTDEEWAILEWWFALPDERAPYRKTDMAACLNNWHAEIAKARRNKGASPPQVESKPRIPDNLRDDYNQ